MQLVSRLRAKVKQLEEEAVGSAWLFEYTSCRIIESNKVNG